MTDLAPTLQGFFTERLGQSGASPNTITSYRDTFRLLLCNISEQLGKAPNELSIADLDAPAIAAFLDYLEHERHNSVRTRNNRLAAIHALFQYAALRHPEHAQRIQRVLAIPPKRFERTIVTFLTPEEVDGLLAEIDLTTWTGRRDRALFVLAIQTGLRISELVSLDVADLVVGIGAHVYCVGKGRKERQTPLTPHTIAVLRPWLAERNGQPHEPLFPTVRGNRLSRDAIEHRVRHYVAGASERCPSMKDKRITTHTLRHTAAMALLHAGVDPTVIALWLGHEQVATTSIYLHADMSQKERAIERIVPPATKPGRYRPPDQLLAFLEAL